jgi:hypothetical protein
MLQLDIFILGRVLVFRDCSVAHVVIVRRHTCIINESQRTGSVFVSGLVLLNGSLLTEIVW